ncbi:MAG: aldolase/citrate lyase family protein [Sulfuricaulis sp.]|nr:aldolase/citrate lyase family protein [Sulfuricaulis sp.]
MVIRRENTIRRRLADGGVALGGVVQTGSPEAVEMMGHAGYDFVLIDTEHGTIDLGMLVHMIRAADAVGLSSMVRVPDHTPSHILRVLDAGAAGILAPHLRSAAEAQALVRAVKFAPVGERGACPSTRATGHLTRDWAAFVREANRDTLVWGLIEDRDGVEAIDEIVAVDGLDGLMFGPFDLAQALGLPGAVTHMQVDALRERVRLAAQARGVQLISLSVWEPGGMTGAKARGARVVIEGSDRALLSAGFRRVCDELSAVFRSS